VQRAQAVVSHLEAEAGPAALGCGNLDGCGGDGHARGASHLCGVERWAHGLDVGRHGEVEGLAAAVQAHGPGVGAGTQLAGGQEEADGERLAGSHSVGGDAGVEWTLGQAHGRADGVRGLVVAGEVAVAWSALGGGTEVVLQPGHAQAAHLHWVVALEGLGGADDCAADVDDLQLPAGSGVDFDGLFEATGAVCGVVGEADPGGVAGSDGVLVPVGAGAAAAWADAGDGHGVRAGVDEPGDAGALALGLVPGAEVVFGLEPFYFGLGGVGHEQGEKRQEGLYRGSERACHCFTVPLILRMTLERLALARRTVTFLVKAPGRPLGL